MPTPTELTDLVVSHYRVQRALGAGGMGEVFEGFDETLKRRVAMKVIRGGKRLDPEAKARFLREARILSQLDHANICRVYDYLETDDRDWLVLELIEGQTLREAIQDGRGATDPLAVARQIAAVLSAMHAAGVVHRDLKPGNVMITPAGDVKVLDFGLSAPTIGAGTDGPFHEPAGSEGRSEVPGSAALADSAWAAAAISGSDLSLFRSQDGAIIGTAAYMSPEQGRGEPATPASDLYSYGLLIEELFSGRLRYPGFDPQRPAAGAGPAVEHHIPDDVASLIAKLKALAPSQRPTADDVVERLDWIADAPRRRRRRLAIAALLMLVLAGAAKYTWDLSRERAAAVAARDDANRRREQAENLIGFMVGDLRTRLTAVGRLEILDEVGQKALAYFQSVPVEALTDVEQFRRSQTMHQLGQVRQARADLPGALTAYEESLALAERVTRSDPRNAEWQLGLGTSHFYVGDIKRRRGDLDGALTHFRAYQDIARQLTERDPANVEWKLELSYGYSNVAAILSGRGDFAGAREQLELTRALQTEIAAAKPGDTAIQLSRGNNYNRLGVVLQRLGDANGAAASFEQELGIYRALSAQDPRNSQFLRRLPASHIFLGIAQRALGEQESALQNFEAALQISRTLMEQDPTNADRQRDAAVSNLQIGHILIANGQSAAAVDRFRSALAAFSPLAAKNPGIATRQRDVALTQVAIADALLEQRQNGAALRECEAGLLIWTHLWTANPSPDMARDLAVAHNLHGRIFAASGDAARAKQAWLRSVELLEPTAPQSVEHTVVDPYVRVLLLLGRRDEAQREFARLSALGYRDRGFMTFWRHYSNTPGGAPSDASALNFGRSHSWTRT